MSDDREASSVANDPPAADRADRDEPIGRGAEATAEGNGNERKRTGPTESNVDASGRENRNADGEREDGHSNDGDGSRDVGGNESEGLFEADFASAFGGGASGRSGGFGGPGGSDGAGTSDGSGGFDDEDDASAEAFDSDIPRIDIGIDGLDEMIRGGVPERSLIAAIGSPGTGKTTVGLQFLRAGLRGDEKAIFIALEESREAVIDTAAEKGWGFERHRENGRLAIVDLDPVEMARSLAGIRSELPRLIDEFGASRVVLDSVSLLETMYDDPAKRRTEVFAFARTLKEAGVTTLLTSEASEETAYASRYGIVEYLTDAVFVLQYVRPSDFQETRLAVEIQKIRNASHSRETKPYEITDEGISVYRRANIF